MANWKHCHRRLLGHVATCRFSEISDRFIYKQIAFCRQVLVHDLTDLPTHRQDSVPSTGTSSSSRCPIRLWSKLLIHPIADVPADPDAFELSDECALTIVLLLKGICLASSFLFLIIYKTTLLLLLLLLSRRARSWVRPNRALSQCRRQGPRNSLGQPSLPQLDGPLPWLHAGSDRTCRFEQMG